MKPMFVILTVISSFFAKSTHASDDVSPAVLHSFQATFNNAKDVVWSVTREFYKVTFYLNDQSVTAFYGGDGELRAVTRNISPLHLPVVLQAQLKKRYTNYWLTDLLEVSSGYGTTYYATLENADAKMVLESNSNVNWVLYEKERK